MPITKERKKQTQKDKRYLSQERNAHLFDVKIEVRCAQVPRE